MSREVWFQENEMAEMATFIYTLVTLAAAYEIRRHQQGGWLVEVTGY